MVEVLDVEDVLSVVVEEDVLDVELVEELELKLELLEVDDAVVDVGQSVLVVVLDVGVVPPPPVPVPQFGSSFLPLMVSWLTPVPSVFIEAIWLPVPNTEVENVILVPSGDHDGVVPPPLGVMSVWFVPSGFIVQIRPSLSKTIRLPSGDQSGWRSATPTRLIWVGLDLPAFTTQMSSPGLNTIRAPSGDHDGLALAEGRSTRSVWPVPSAFMTQMSPSRLA